jgi:hypothetical protein
VRWTPGCILIWSGVIQCVWHACTWSCCIAIRRTVRPQRTPHMCGCQAHHVCWSPGGFNRVLSPLPTASYTLLELSADVSCTAVRSCAQPRIAAALSAVRTSLMLATTWCLDMDPTTVWARSMPTTTSSHSWPSYPPALTGLASGEPWKCWEQQRNVSRAGFLRQTD